MAAYNIPASLIDDFIKIKSKLHREFVRLYLSGNKSATECYRLACKKLKKKISKNPRTSASEILTNPNVLRFVAKAEAILASEALLDIGFSFKSRLDVTQAVIKIGLRKYEGGGKDSATDILKAVEIQNHMLNGFKRFEGMTPEEIHELDEELTGGDK